MVNVQIGLWRGGKNSMSDIGEMFGNNKFGMSGDGVINLHHCRTGSHVILEPGQYFIKGEHDEIMAIDKTQNAKLTKTLIPLLYPFKKYVEREPIEAFQWFEYMGAVNGVFCHEEGTWWYEGYRVYNGCYINKTLKKVESTLAFEKNFKEA